MSKDSEIGRALVDEIDRRMFGECQPRIVRCLGELTDEEIWRRPNEQSNSVGNLVLHLCGNIRQWVISTLGGEADHRRRSEEFAERGPIAKEELIAKFNETLDRAREVIRGLDLSALTEKRWVQGNEESVVSIIVHVCEHLSYHTGQIAYYVKAGKGIDLAFYGGVDLNVTAGERK